MHRKRGGSLEQGLVMPSPHSSSSSAPTAAHHLHHPYPSSSIDDGNRPAFPNDGCFSRLPFASIAAFLLCLFGVILFTTMMLWAFNATIEQIRRATYITDLPWLDKVQLLFIISAVAMLVVALTFLLIGVISTGQTRESIFHRKESRRGGRVSCILAICLASLLNLIWMLILALTAVLCFVYTIFLAMCSTTPSAKNGHSCLDLSVFKTLFPSTTTNGQATLQFCDGELQQFCALSNTIVVWYYVGLLGALLICLGLVQFIATNAANYAHIGNEARYSELREVLYAELEGYPLGKMGDERAGLEGGAAGNWRDAKLPPPAYIGDTMDYRAHNQPFDYREQQQQMPRENGSHWKHHSNQQHHFTKNDANQQQQQQHQAHHRFHQPQMRAKNHHRSVGAVVGTLRRNSYQNSLNGAAYD